jgi:hypothetical protein
VSAGVRLPLGTIPIHTRARHMETVRYPTPCTVRQTFLANHLSGEALAAGSFYRSTWYPERAYGNLPLVRYGSMKTHIHQPRMHIGPIHPPHRPPDVHGQSP